VPLPAGRVARTASMHTFFNAKQSPSLFPA